MATLKDGHLIGPNHPSVITIHNYIAKNYFRTIAKKNRTKLDANFIRAFRKYISFHQELAKGEKDGSEKT